MRIDYVILLKGCIIVKGLNITVILIEKISSNYIWINLMLSILHLIEHTHI